MFATEIGVQITRFDARKLRQIVNDLFLSRNIFIHERYAFVDSIPMIKKNGRSENCKRSVGRPIYPRMHVIRATLMWLGLIVAVLPSGRISFSSGFNVTNSASIATKSPLTGISSAVNGLNVRSYCLFLHNCWLITSCWRWNITLKTTAVLRKWTATDCNLRQ